jgi:5-methylcytosine-specific restriction endonuclease McrA
VTAHETGLTGHHCVIAAVHGGIGLCACGQAWTPAGTWLRNRYLVSPDLLHRLKFHQRAIAAGRAADLRDSVKRSAAYEAAHQATERAGAREAWRSRQSGKRQKWMRVMRALLLPAPCAYCGGDADVVEHVIPRTRGGPDKRSNVVPACTRCNLAKRNRTPEEWKADMLRRGQPWPPPWGKRAA